MVGVAGWGVTATIAGWLGGSAIATVAASVIVGAVVGAVVGGLVAAVTGGSIGSGVLFGAIGGAVAGGISGALGGAASGSAGSAGSLTAAATEGAAGSGYTGFANVGTSAMGSNVSLLGTGEVAGAGSSAAGGASAGAVSGLSESAWQLGSNLVAGGLQSWYEADQAGEVRDAAAREAQLNREQRTKEAEMTAATARATAGAGSDFHLAERMTLAEQEFNARAKLSEQESGQRMTEYQKQVATNEEALQAGRKRAASGILGIETVPKNTQFVEGVGIDTQVAQTDAPLEGTVKKEQDILSGGVLSA